MGHNCPPHDTGAVGIEKEDVLIKDVGTRLMAKLSAAGHSVINCTPSFANSANHSLQQRVNKANANNVDIFISIHFNAFQPTQAARGSEVYGISNAAQAIARSVLEEIVALGFINREVREKPQFFVIKKTSMPAILIECCFVDSQADMNLFNAEKMAEAIAVGLIGERNNPATPQPTTIKTTQATILKHSTEQASDLDPDTLVNIAVGSYEVLDLRREERHFWVQWPDKSKANRDEHFIFEEHAEIVNT